MTAKDDTTKNDAMKTIRLFLTLVILIFLLTACSAATSLPTNVAATPVPAVTRVPTNSSVATEEPTLISPPPTGTSAALSLDQQMAQIDAILKQTLGASIAYNKPESMKLDQTATIELLLNPSESPQDLSTQVVEPGQVVSASIQITPRMKALLFPADNSAFIIKPIHDNPEQLISTTDTTRWAWLVTAKKGGTQQLTLVIYRLVEYEGQDYWREVQTYKADIVVEVTFSTWFESLDWKWIASAILIPLLVAAWGWFRNKKKNSEENKPVPTPGKK